MKKILIALMSFVLVLSLGCSDESIDESIEVQANLLGTWKIVAYENSDLSQNPINSDKCDVSIRFNEHEDEHYISLNSLYSYTSSKYNFTSGTSIVLSDNIIFTPICYTEVYFNCNINDVPYHILNNGEHAFKFEDDLLRFYYSEGSVLLETFE
jgi:hypothetical protein